MNIAIFFDFHDIFVDARRAWVKAFSTLAHTNKVVEDYNKGVSKKEICQKYNIDYTKAEVLYRKNLKLIKDNYIFANLLSKFYQINLLSCSNINRLNKDLNKFNLSCMFHKIYCVKDIRERHNFLLQEAKKYDWILFFNHENQQIQQFGNLILLPINLRGDFSQFKDISFDEHAKNKLIYNELSDYYMQAIGNDTDKEVSFIENIYKRYIGQNIGGILDCCCGVGRHSFALGEKGFHVVGVDISKNQIDNANKIHKNTNTKYLVGDVRNIDLAKKDFDMAICMWTTYNYFSLDKDLKKFLTCIFKHIKTGGLVILDSKNIPKLANRRVYTRETKQDKLCVNLLINKFVIDNIQNSQYLYFINNDGKFSFWYDDEYVRFYYIKELKRIAKDMFKIIKIYGDFDSSNYKKKRSERFIVVMRKL